MNSAHNNVTFKFGAVPFWFETFLYMFFLLKIVCIIMGTFEIHA